MEVEVDQYSIDKKYIEIEKNELILDTERLLEHIICQDVKNVVMHAVVLPENDNCLSHDKFSNELLKCENDHLMELLISQDIVHTIVNSLAAINDYKCMKKSFVDEYNETLELKEIFIINELQAQLKTKNVSIDNSKKHIANLKGKTSVEYAKTVNKSNVVTSTIYKLDLQPLPPRIKNNREAHLDYLKVTQEHTNTLWDIVEQARALKPLYNSLDYAFAITPLDKTRKVRVSYSTEASGSQTKSNTKKNRITQTSRSNKNNQVGDQPRIVKSSLNNVNRVSNIPCNVNFKHYVINANSELISVICNECMFDAIHDSCVHVYLNDVNAHVKSKSVKSNKKKV
ncbi:hypothetical protein Tco_0855646 [Tanacetum coccineum]